MAGSEEAGGSAGVQCSELERADEIEGQYADDGWDSDKRGNRDKCFAVGGSEQYVYTDGTVLPGVAGGARRSG